MSNKETKLTPVQAAIKFWTDRRNESKVAGLTITKEAADLFLQYLDVMLEQENKFMESVWDAGSENYKQYVKHNMSGTPFTCPDKTQFFSQYENTES